jgi:transposase
MDAVVAKLVDADPFASTVQLVRKVNMDIGTNVSLSTIARSRRRMGYKFKIAARSQEHQRADSSHPFFSMDRVYDGSIAIDESSFVSSDRPRRGWARRNRNVPKAPPTARTRISLLLAIDQDGIVAMDHKRGAYNSSSYADFVSGLPEDRTLIADNVAFHKSKVVKEVAKSRRQHLCYTPPYCPWFNPVEFAFSVSKAAYRRARLHGSTDFVGEALDAVRTRVTPEKCKMFFRHASNNVNCELLRIKDGK